MRTCKFTFDNEENRQRFKATMLQNGRECFECTDVVTVKQDGEELTFTLLQLAVGKREGEGDIAANLRLLKGKR